MLLHPGRTSTEMAAALLVAESTRRSNVSRLRGWLGTDSAGNPYLPEAYSGNIVLHPAVTSDFERLELMLVGGPSLASDQNLENALRLVRGAPLADVAPGQWTWAEDWRSRMIALIRDAAAELSRRALAGRRFDQARWACGVGLSVAPDDDRLLIARLRAEHVLGNLGEVERLSLQITRRARRFGYELSPDMVRALQETAHR
jgi:hypothetical protein